MTNNFQEPENSNVDDNEFTIDQERELEEKSVETQEADSSNHIIECDSSGENHFEIDEERVSRSEGKKVPDIENEIVSEEERVTVTENEAVQEPEKNVENGKNTPDYALLSRAELVGVLRGLVEKGDAESMREDLDLIKFQFYKKLKGETERAKSAFVEEGGTEDGFVYEEDDLERALKSLINKYRILRNEQNEKLEAEKFRNLAEKNRIIDELKELTGGTESIGDTFQQFRDLQNRWRTIGLVPQSEVKNLWETYHHHVEVFYDYIKINKELRDLDFRRNLEAKILLCEKAEKLLMEDSVVNAFHTLQTYHDQWREIGPVPQEMRTEIWERFKTVSSKINRIHQEHFEELKDVQKKNLEAKLTLCEKLEEMLQTPITTMSQWEKKGKEVIEMQKLWNTIGFATKKENSNVNKRFHTLCDRFFNQKREFFSEEKSVQENNLQLKEDLCVQAEALKDSTEWKTTSTDMIKLQKRWKEIGSVPQKYRESIWKRFRTACDYFFNQKAEHFSSVDSEYENNLKIKQDLIERIQSFAPSGNTEETFEQLKDFQKQWSETGFVPIKYKKKIQNEYREAINKQFDALKLDEGKRTILRYKSKLENLAHSSRNKVDSERDKLMRKYQQLQNDLVVWENNIGFFSKSRNSEAMIANVQRMIEQGRAEMKELEEKIRMIDSIDE